VLDEFIASCAAGEAYACVIRAGVSVYCDLQQDMKLSCKGQLLLGQC